MGQVDFPDSYLDGGDPYDNTETNGAISYVVIAAKRIKGNGQLDGLKNYICQSCQTNLDAR